ANRLSDAVAEGVENLAVAGHGVEQRYRFGDREGEVIADRAVRPRAHRQLPAGPGIEVIAQAVEGELVHHTIQAEQPCPLPAPGADQLLPLAEIIRAGVIFL